MTDENKDNLIDIYEVAHGGRACKKEVLAGIQENHGDDGVDRDPIAAITHTPAYRVFKYFAVREVYAPHPCGEDMWMHGAKLDHIPSGSKLYAGGLCGFGVASGKSCEAFAKSVSTLPVDWSEKEPDVSKYLEFIKTANDAAGREESVEWSGEDGGGT